MEIRPFFLNYKYAEILCNYILYIDMLNFLNILEYGNDGNRIQSYTLPVPPTDF
jgi:hypothetical protein